MEISDKTRTYRERVARGVELLDKLVPGWHRKIDLEALDLSSCESCICGQLAFNTASQAIENELSEYGSFAAYGAFRKFLGQKLRRKNARALAEEILADPENFGFCTIGEQYPTLDAEWQRIIKARLETGR